MSRDLAHQSRSGMNVLGTEEGTTFVKEGHCACVALARLKRLGRDREGRHRVPVLRRSHHHRRLLHQDHHQEHLPFQSLPSLCQQPTVAGRNFHQDKVITSLWYGDNIGSELLKQTTATRIKNVINNAEDGLNPHQAYSAYLLTQAGLFENIPAHLNKAIVRRHCMSLRIELYRPL